MHKSILTISREWHNPQIRTTVTNREISLEMSMEDFEKALIHELGKYHCTWQMDKKVKNALAKILRVVKEESAKAV